MTWRDLYPNIIQHPNRKAENTLSILSSETIIQSIGMKPSGRAEKQIKQGPLTKVWEAPSVPWQT